VLEIAAGTGIVTRCLRDLLPAGAELTATDLNPPMLDVARAKFRLEERVRFQPADATASPFSEAAFDAVVCQFGVMFFPDKLKSFQEVHRVLAPGGRYLFSVWDSQNHNTFGRITHEVIGGFFPADPPQFYSVPFGYYKIDPIRDALADAGFPELNVAILRIEKETADLASFARALVHGNPVIEQIRARGEVAPDRIAAALTEALLQEFGRDPSRIPLQAIIFEARKG
jgi:SAM-dependent methyltransferase